MRAFDLIRSRQEVYSIGEETTVYDAARYLRDHRVRSVGVLDAAGKLSGVVSQSDISDKVAAENKCPAWTRVTEIMSQDLLIVDPEFPLEECMCLME
jgi:CBS domain-containing protein